MTAEFGPEPVIDLMLKSLALAFVAAVAVVALAFGLVAAGIGSAGEALLWPGWRLWRLTVGWFTSTQSGSTLWALGCYLLTWWIPSLAVIEVYRRQAPTTAL